MNIRFIPLMMIISSLLSFSTLYADYDIHKAKSSINWEKGYIFSQGESVIYIKDNGEPADYYNMSPTTVNKARKNAYTKAREAAILEMIDSFKSIRIDNNKKIKDLVMTDVFTQKRLSALMQNSISISEYPGDFFTSICEVRLRTSSIIASLPFSFPSYDFPVEERASIPTYYSGIIIDTRGLGIKPMLFPSIYNKNGREIYGRLYIDGQYASKYGIVTYCYSERDAFRNKNAGKHPYYTAAILKKNGCPVLSNKDTRKILGHKGTINNLKKCRVIFIL